MARQNRSYFFTTVPDKTRFVKGDRPTEQTFSDFADSVGFITESGDAAKELQQGYVRLATSADVKNYQVPTDGLSYAVQADQLPEVNQDPVPSPPQDVPANTILVTKDTSSLPRRLNIKLRLHDNFINWLIGRLFPAGGVTGDVVVKNSSSNYAFSWQNLGNVSQFITTLLANAAFTSKLNALSDPPGTIKMYAGDLSVDFPGGTGTGRWLGWAICDGRPGTINLKGKFVVGYDPASPATPNNQTGQAYNYGAIANTGGQDFVTLIENQMPIHSHSVNDPSHSHGYFQFNEAYHNWQAGSNSTTNGYTGYNLTSVNTFEASTGISLGNTGGGLSHENRPPYTVLAYVQKIA